MATQEIDKLSLSIEVTDLDKKQVENVSYLADALERLNKVLDNGFLDKIKDVGIKLDVKGEIKQVGEELNNISKEIQDKISSSISNGVKSNVKGQKGNQQFDLFEDIKPENEMKKVSDGYKIIKTSVTELADGTLKAVNTYSNLKGEVEKITYSLDNSGRVLDSTKTQISKLDLKIKQAIQSNKSFTSAQNEITKSAKESAEVFKEYFKSEEDGNKSLEKNTKKSTSSLNKFFKSVKRIALYRAIRWALKEITNSFLNSIQSLVLFDKEYNKTISSIKTSLTNINSSIGLIVRPFMEILAPALESISNSFVTIVNEFSKAMATAQGLTTYTKVSSKYAEDYAKSLQKANRFSFDTFNTLNLEQSRYEKEEITPDNQNNANVLLETIVNIKEILGTVYNLFKGIASVLKPTLKVVISSLNKILRVVSKIINDFSPFIKELFELISPLVNMILDTLLPPLLEIAETILPVITSLLGVVFEILKPIINLISIILKPVLEVVAVVIKTISHLLSSIFTIIEPLLTAVGEIAGYVLDAFLNLSMIEPALIAVQTIFSAIFDSIKIISSFIRGDFSGAWNIFKLSAENSWNAIKKIGYLVVRGIAKSFDALINTFISAVNGLWENVQKLWSWIPGAKTFDGISWKSDIASKIPSFYNGGVVGEIWQMNEYGKPEMLFNQGGSNSTSVITQSQLSQAFIQAIYQTNLLEVIKESGQFVLDGRMIAQSSSFKNEINRTNPNLNLK